MLVVLGRGPTGSRRQAGAALREANRYVRSRSVWSRSGEFTSPNGGVKPLLLEKRILFFKNEARKLLKTKDGCGKSSQNEPKTKLAKLLKINRRHKNEAKKPQDACLAKLLKKHTLPKANRRHSRT
ncbi:MAG TPA: hypothetical protein VMW54_14015 [Terriglobia bacterium]|nr:hypothetical protein [Terriglobia bacterium]